MTLSLVQVNFKAFRMEPASYLHTITHSYSLISKRFSRTKKFWCRLLFTLKEMISRLVDEQYCRKPLEHRIMNLWGQIFWTWVILEKEQTRKSKISHIHFQSNFSGPILGQAFYFCDLGKYRIQNWNKAASHLMPSFAYSYEPHVLMKFRLPDLVPLPGNNLSLKEYFVFCKVKSGTVRIFPEFVFLSAVGSRHQYPTGTLYLGFTRVNFRSLL